LYTDKEWFIKRSKLW